jgi:transposase
MPAKYVRPYSKGEKNDYRDAEAIAEAVQRPTMKFVATKSAEQLDLQALHRVRERLVGQRTGIINQIRAFLLERGIAVRQGLSVTTPSPNSRKRISRRASRSVIVSSRRSCPRPASNMFSRSSSIASAVLSRTKASKCLTRSQC